jgi:hypothetical protein
MTVWAKWRRTVTVYVDGRKALRFRRTRGPGGTRDVRLVFRRDGVPDDVVDRTRADILRRWTWREED